MNLARCRRYIFFALLVPIHAFAWSWKEVVDQAYTKNPALNSRRENVTATRLLWENARALRRPTLDIVGRHVEILDRNKERDYRTNVGPELQYLLYQGGKVSAGIDQTLARNQQADLSVRVLSVTTQSRLREAYAGALYAKNYLDLAHRIEERRKENVKFTQIRYESGLDYKWVYVSSNAKWQKAQLDLQEAQLNKHTALADLEAMLGQLPVQSVEELTEEGFYTTDSNYQLDQLMAGIENNPKFQLQQSKIEEAKASVEYADADHYPQIGLFGDAWLMGTNQYGLFPALFGGVNLRMPIYQAGKIDRNVRIAQANLSQEKFNLEQARLDIQNSVRKTYQSYVIAKQQVDVSKLNVEAAKDRAKVVTSHYRTGIASFLEWESSQDGWVNSELELLNSIRNYRVSRARLDEAIGTELSK